MNKCFECGEQAEHNHHVIPKVNGGTKTVPLCIKCHALVHDRKSMSSSELVKIGLMKYKETGGKLGTHRWPIPREKSSQGGLKSAVQKKKDFIIAYAEIIPMVRQMRAEGLSLRQIAEALNNMGHRTRQGFLFQKQQVKKIVDCDG